MSEEDGHRWQIVIERFIDITAPSSCLSDPEDADAAVADAQNIAHRLQQDVSEGSGKIHVFLASRLAAPPTDGSSSLLLTGGHRGSLTTAVASSNGRYVYTAAKDGRILRWKMENGRIDVIIPQARKGGQKSGSASRAREVRAAQEPQMEAMDDSISDVTMQDQQQSTAERSRSSGTSRRKARKAGAAAAAGVAAVSNSLSLANGKGKAKATVPYGAAEIVDLAPGEGHTKEVWALSVSSDGRMLVSGGTDKHIGIWAISDDVSGDSPSAQWVKALTGHKDSISGLKFRIGSHMLYTTSLDRTVKTFDVAQLGHMDTFFGHQESILSIDALKGETAVTAGGRDRTARWFKDDGNQLIFRGGAKNKMREVAEGGDLLGDAKARIQGDRGGQVVEGSLDCVAMIDEHHFLTGGDSGAISLWSLDKKKPIFSRAATHGFDASPDSSGQPISTPRWITSIACLPYGDLFASGSWDGSIRLWALDSRMRSFKPLFSISAPGFINSLQLLQPPRSSLQKAIIKPELWKARLKVKQERGEAADSAPTLVNGDSSKPVNGSGSVPGRKEMVPPILVAAIGSEPRLGRWMKDKKVKSAGLVVPLSFQ